MRRTAFFEPAESDSDSDSDDTDTEPNQNSPDNWEPRTHETKPFNHHKFQNPSNFDPNPERYPALDTYCRSTRLQIYKHQTRPCKFSNLSKGERRAIKDLKKNPHIIIKPADKGGCTVIQNTIDYIIEAERQLSDTRFYSPQTQDLTPIHNNKVKHLITSLNNTAISQEVTDFLIFEKPRTPAIYFLPKIHKNQRPPPGRPIVSANQCPTERISGLIDHLLRPYVPLPPSYVKDTTDFVNHIERLPRLEASDLLVTLDVTSLYTNIPNEESLQTARDTLHKHRQDTHEALKNDHIVALLELVLTCNNFEFNGQHFLQTQGVAMGTRVAPTIANLVMGAFEEKYIYQYHLPPPIWLRYIDDNFMIWPHGQAQLDIFMNHLNTVHPTLKFTHETSPESLTFLDTRVIKDHTGQLYTTLYTKPTDTHAYLHYSSCHPKHQKTSGPYSQFLRIKRICSKSSDYQKEANKLIDHYINRGYPHEDLLHAKHMADQQRREELLTPKEKPQLSLSERPLFCTIPYNPSNPPIKSILQQNWHMLETDPRLKCFMNKELIVGHTRATSIKDILVSSHLDYHPNSTATILNNPSDPKKCNRTHCRYCLLCDHNGAIRSTTTKRRYIIPQYFSCESNNLIYAITCRKCGSQYVGQTSNTIRQRFQKHLKDIEHASNWNQAPPSYQNTGKTNVGRHFSQRDHSASDVTIQVLELIRVNPQSETAQKLRLERENYWMHQLKTVFPTGINATDGSNHSRHKPNIRRKPRPSPRTNPL